MPVRLKSWLQQLDEILVTDGQIIIVMVTDISESTVRPDANHPLAGKDLIFEIQPVEVL